MKPIDYRNASFADLQSHLNADRKRVLAAWRLHGPCTTEDLASRCGMSILSIRPRTTELVQLGFVILAGGKKRGGCYRAASAEETLDHFRDQQQLANGKTIQTSLALNLPPISRFY